MDKKPASLYTKLVLPICLATTLLWVVGSMVITGVYLQQSESSVVQSSGEILRQSAHSLNLIHEHVAKVIQQITQTPYIRNTLSTPVLSVSDEWEKRRILGKVFTSVPNAMLDYEVTLVGSNGLAASSGNGGVNYTAEQLMTLPISQRALQTNSISYDSVSPGISFSSRDENIILGCRVFTSANIPYGAVLISIREQSLRDFYQNFAQAGTDIILISNDGTILSSQHSELVGETDLELLTVAQHNTANKLTSSRPGNDTIIVSEPVPSMQSYMVSRISVVALRQACYPVVLRLSLFIVPALGILIFFIALTLRHNLYPLQQLASHMSGPTGLRRPPMDIQISSEIQMLVSSYNDLLQQIDIYLAELETAYAKRRKDELNLLQMQINPHFLYNTLGGVKNLVAMNDSQAACKTIDALISLLRSTIGHSYMLVSVKQESSNAQNYIDIITPRYGGLVLAKLNVDDNCLDYEIPNLLLQPLIENAFFHAFQNTKSGNIRIYIALEEGMLCCEVTDNGDGMSPEQLEKLLSEHNDRKSSVTHIGLRNVRERLQMLYGDKHSFRITSEPDYGTHIQIQLPARRISTAKKI